MKKLLSGIFICLSLLLSTVGFGQCPNEPTNAGGSLTPPSVGGSANATYGAGSYVLAFVVAGGNYTVTTCGTSTYDTQLTVYEDDSGTFLAYNDDACGLQTSTSFTAPRCCFVRVVLHQYSCNPSGAVATVTMNWNSGAGNFPVVTVPDVSTCTGIPISIGSAAPATGGSGTYTYSWGPVGGLDNPLLPNPTATVSSATTYTLTATDANNCSGSDPMTVNITPNPTVNLGVDTTICPSSSIILNAGNPGSTYSWSDASALQTLSVSTSGTYSVTVTTPDGCVGTDNITIGAGVVPTVNIGPDSIQCGGSVVLDAGNPGSTYSWNGGATTQTLSASSTGTYSVTVTSVNGCTANDNANITIDPLPVVALGSDVTQCAGTVLLDAGNTGSTFMWNDASSLQTLTASVSGTYYVNVTDPGTGCSAADTIMVTINPLPVVMLGADTAICSTMPFMLDAGNAGATYLWSDASTAQTLSVSTTGTYGVLVTNSSTGCSASDTIDVTINPQPTVNIGPDSVRCGGSVLLDAGNPGATYSWSDASGLQTLSASSTGNYYVTVTDINGCMNSDSAMITINMLPVVNLGADQTICGDSVTIDAGNPGLTYLWNNSTTNQTLTTFISGAFDVVVTDTVTGCSGMDTVNITIGTVPSLDLGADTTQCGGSITLDAGAGATTYAWASGPATQTYIVSANGTYMVTITNAAGCSASDTIVVTINPLPTVGLTPFSTPICLQASAFTLMNGTPSGGVYSGTGVTSGMFDPAAAGVGSYSITYTVTNVSTGCQNSTSQTITVQDCSGIAEQSNNNVVAIAPNPSTGSFLISIRNADFSDVIISLFDIQGKNVYELKDENTSAEYSRSMNVEGLSKGLYYMRIMIGGNYTTHKLIIQ